MSIYYGFDPEEDYSIKILEAEKHGDVQQAAQLEAIRNRKIDAMNLPYEKTYKYQDLQQGGFGPTRYTGFDSSGYQGRAESYDKMYDAAYQQQAELLAQQQQENQRRYDQLAQDEYVAYRRQQQAMPQQLAAAGLSGQGITETAATQLYGDYRNAVGQNESARQQSQKELERALADAAYQRDAAKAGAALQVGEQQQAAYQSYLAAAQAQDNWNRSYYQGVAQNAYGNALDEAALTGRYQNKASLPAQSQAFQQAYERMMAIGYVLPWDAAVLGVPAGTKTADYVAQLASAAQGWSRLSQR